MNNMNQKKMTLGILLVGVIMLSIGFAAYTASLTIKSTATVTPSSSNFGVVFSKSSTSVDTSDVTVDSTSTTTGTPGKINDTTISNLSANFTAPNQKAIYKFYAYNKGEYVAYLNSITFIGNKSCTATGDVTEELLNNACNSIKMTVQVGSTSTEVTKQNITGESIDPKEAALVTVTLEYINGGAVADGTFTVNFSDVSLYYGTREGLTENVNPPSTGNEICKAVDTSKAGSTTVGTEYECQVSSTESHNFYVLGTSADGTKVNLLMNENLENDAAFMKDGPAISTDNWSIDESIEGATLKDQSYVINQVETLTATWSNLTTYNETYSAGNEWEPYTIPLTGKARLPKYEEIAALCPNVGESKELHNPSDDFYYTTQSHRYGCPTWVTDTSYWTMDISYDGEVVAWAVSSQYKSLDDYNIFGKYDTDLNIIYALFGIRPVITVNTSDLS